MGREGSPFDDFFPIPSLSTTFSAHCTLGPLPRGGCSPRSLRIGSCADCACVSVCEPAFGSAARVDGPPAPLPAGDCVL